MDVLISLIQISSPLGGKRWFLKTHQFLNLLFFSPLELLPKRHNVVSFRQYSTWALPHPSASSYAVLASPGFVKARILR